MEKQLQPGRYASLHIRGRKLLFPASEAQLLHTKDKFEFRNGVACVHYDNQWAPLFALDDYFKLINPDSDFALVLDDGEKALALACDQLSWTTLAEGPKDFPGVLGWPGCPICSISELKEGNTIYPVWISTLSHLWQSLCVQSELVNEPECLAS